jgi:hypothetical protein
VDLNREFNTNEEAKKILWENFKHNFDMIGRKPSRVNYPDRLFQIQGVPTPRQYIAWREAIELMGADLLTKSKENAEILPLELVSVADKQVFFVDKFTDFYKEGDKLEITIACGFFWKSKTKCRHKMMDFLAENMIKHNWKVIIYTQDKTLKKEFRDRCNVSPKIYKVPYRIDLHYTIARKLDGSIEERDKQSYIFMELPHTEMHLYRLNIYFSFEYGDNNFSCGSINDFLQLLEEQRKPHLIKRSIPSYFNYAINRGLLYGTN